MMYRAYHRWMDDYCGAFPARHGGHPGLSARRGVWPRGDRRLGDQALAFGALRLCPLWDASGSSRSEPYWKAAAEYDLGVVLHTFTVMPPYAPGGLDTWDNLWLRRSAAHPGAACATWRRSSAVG